jgi:hypothetical protein
VSTTYIRNTIAFAINHFGEASHPYADEQSLPSFKQHYAIKCVDAAVETATSNRTTATSAKPTFAST